MEGRKTLNQNDVVEFDVIENSKGSQAVNVKPLLTVNDDGSVVVEDATLIVEDQND